MIEDIETRIKKHEGFCSVPKLDVSPMYVIGFGHDITKEECDDYASGISYTDAETLLMQDIMLAKTKASKAFPWMLGLDDVRQSVIYEAVFQLGLAGVEKFKKMISAIRDKNWEVAAAEMLNSKWHEQTPSRVEELADLMLNGNDNNASN